MMSPGLSHAGRLLAVCAAVATLQALAAGCRPRNEDRPSEPTQASEPQEPNRTSVPARSIEQHSIPRFAKNSPFSGDYRLSAQSQDKRLWARSFLWEKAPEFVVEKWLTSEPDRRNKYVLIEFWATWCGPCRRSIPVLNEIHRQFGDRLVVVGISDEQEEAVRAFKEPAIEYSVAVDTQARMKTALGVEGIPHVIVLEREGHVVWEGFPLLTGHELTVETIQRILEAGARSRSIVER